MANPRGDDTSVRGYPLGLFETFESVMSATEQVPRPFLLDTIATAFIDHVVFQNGLVMSWNGVIQYANGNVDTPNRKLDGTIVYPDKWVRFNGGVFRAPSGLEIDSNSLILRYRNGVQVAPGGVKLYPPSHSGGGRLEAGNGKNFVGIIDQPDRRAPAQADYVRTRPLPSPPTPRLPWLSSYLEDTTPASGSRQLALPAPPPSSSQPVAGPLVPFASPPLPVAGPPLPVAAPLLLLEGPPSPPNPQDILRARLPTRFHEWLDCDHDGCAFDTLGIPLCIPTRSPARWALFTIATTEILDANGRTFEEMGF